ncbi:MAG: peptide deformylase [Candidatus Hydrogenedentota bacterium]
MPLLNIVLYPDDPLTRVADPVGTVTPEYVRLAMDMIETMHAYDGCGLAGPQVGLAQRIFVMHAPDQDPRCLINPEILEAEGSEIGEEGCLSIPEVYADVPRATRIRVKALDELGHPVEFEANDFEARIIQHEMDHLNGILIVDRVDILTRQSMLQEWEPIRSRLLMTPKKR